MMTLWILKTNTQCTLYCCLHTAPLLASVVAQMGAYRARPHAVHITFFHIFLLRILCILHCCIACACSGGRALGSSACCAQLRPWTECRFVDQIYVNLSFVLSSNSITICCCILLVPALSSAAHLKYLQNSTASASLEALTSAGKTCGNSHLCHNFLSS